MNQGNGKKIGIFVGIAVVCFVLVYAGIALTQNRGKTSTEVRTEDARRSLDKMLKNVYIEEIEARKASVSLASSSLAEELPDISKYPLAVEGNGPINIEITTSTEKGGTGNDGWLNAVAKEFNESNTQVGGQQVSVSIRSMASGLAVDYIISGKYRPDAFTPSNELWGEMIRSEGIEIEKVAERLVGNVAGILLSKENTQVLKEAYGDVDMTSITTATAENALAMGYTNPLASSTGLNFLLSTLYAYDPSNPLSEAAVAGFNAFQLNVPFVAYTTLQMREAAGTGSLEGMILEYQTYVNEPELASYEFTPFGIRHDNPLYSIGELSVDQQEGLEMFLDFCKGESSQQLANECGFNGLDDYKCDQPTTDGKVLKAAQKLWKENKDGCQLLLLHQTQSDHL